MVELGRNVLLVLDYALFLSARDELFEHDFHRIEIAVFQISY